MKIPNLLKPSRKKLIILVALVLLAGLGFWFFGRKKQTPLQFTNVKKQDIRSSVSSSGNLTGKNIANLKFKSSGKLSFINVKIGDPIKQYRTIAGLDTKELTIALQQAQNTYRDKQAIAEKAVDDVKDHSSDESFAQKVTRTTAQATRDSAFDSVKNAQRALEEAVITSPLSGIVTQAIQVTGQNITTTDLIAQVVDTSSIYFDTDVDEADINHITVGAPAEVSLDAYPKEIFKGMVDQILPQTKTTSSGATVVTVRIILDNPKLTFVNGLSGESAIIYARSNNALTIPQEALREDQSVVVSQDNKLVEKKIEVGISSDTDVEVKSGLSEGDKVLLSPPAPGTKLNK